MESFWALRAIIKLVDTKFEVYKMLKFILCLLFGLWRSVFWYDIFEVSEELLCSAYSL